MLVDLSSGKKDTETCRTQAHEGLPEAAFSTAQRAMGASHYGSVSPVRPPTRAAVLSSAPGCTIRLLRPLDPSPARKRILCPSRDNGITARLERGRVHGPFYVLSKTVASGSVTKNT